MTNELKERIYTGELRPGTLLPYPEVAGMLGVSTGRARFALVELRELSLVVTPRGRTASVATVPARFRTSAASELDAVLSEPELRPLRAKIHPRRLLTLSRRGEGQDLLNQGRQGGESAPAPFLERACADILDVLVYRASPIFDGADSAPVRVCLGRPSHARTGRAAHLYQSPPRTGGGPMSIGTSQQPTFEIGRLPDPLGVMVEQRIREAIYSGRLAAGTVLTDQTVADWLGVSRTPVREAFLVLRHHGLLTGKRFGSVRVTRPAEQELPAIRSAYRALTAALLGLAVREGKATGELRQRNESALRSAEQQDSRSYFLGRLHLLDWIGSACAGSSTRPMFEPLVRTLLFQISVASTRATDWTVTQERHRRLSARIEDDDPAGIRQAALSCLTIEVGLEAPRE